VTNELIGSARYMSNYAHQCQEQGRRDDLEAFAYVFIYFLCGKLPWSGIKVADFREHNKKICRIKRTFPSAEMEKKFPK